MRMHIFTRPGCLVALAALFIVGQPASPRADEGMWTFDHPADGRHSAALRLHGDQGVARPPAVVERAIQ